MPDRWPKSGDQFTVNDLSDHVFWNAMPIFMGDFLFAGSDLLRFFLDRR
jgi:hypothetical protein